MHWYVQVQGQNFGPYTEEQMHAFVAEGRINEHSMVYNDLQTGFFPAVGFENYSIWSGAAGMAQVVNSTPVYQPQYQQPQTNTSPVSTSPASLIANIDLSAQRQSRQNQSAAGIFLIMAEIKSEGSMAFLQAIQGFGLAQRVGDTVWLLKTSASGTD